MQVMESGECLKKMKYRILGYVLHAEKSKILCIYTYELKLISLSEDHSVNTPLSYELYAFTITFKLLPE